MSTFRDDPYVECRRGAAGHAWERQALAKRASFGQPRDWLCVGCGTVKHQIIDANGNLAAQWYTKPRDYKLEIPYTTEDVRLESLRRARRSAA